MPSRRAFARSLRAVGLVAVTALAFPQMSTVAHADVTDVTYVVTFDAPPTPNDVDVLRGVVSAVHPFTAIPAAVVVLPAPLVPLLRNLPGVRGVWSNERYRYLDLKADQSIKADQAWGPYTGGLGYTGTGWTGAGIGIGVIDAGVDGTHPDLCGLPEFCRGTPVKTVQNVKFIGDTDHADPVVPVENVVSSDSTSGHGSHVAGIAAGYGTASSVPGIYQGVAPGAHLVGMGTGEAIEVMNVLAAFDYALTHRDAYNIKVLNNSWGPGVGTPYDPDHPVNRAIDAAWNAGISVVFGAGNDGPRTDALNAFSVNPHAISVAATNKNTTHMAFFSSRGVPGSPFWHPTVAAPGENIISVRNVTGAATHAGDASSANPEPMTTEDTPYYGNVSGTSMASPHVAGVVALMQDAAYSARGRYLTPQQVKNILQNTTQTGVGAGMPNYQQYSMGAGLVDAAAAARAAAALTSTQAYDDHVTYDVRPFHGTVGPAAFVQTSVFESTIDVAPGAVSLDVMADWKTAYADDVDINVYDPSGTLRGGTMLLCGAPQPNGYSSFCSSAPNERLTYVAPAAGTWKVSVGGFVNSSEDVRGLWSVAYPDGVSVPAAAPPASLTLTAATSASVQSQADALTATVTDAAGNLVPNAPVVWTSTGAGEVSHAEAYTAGDGSATANALSDAPGTQTVTATVGSLTSSVSITWVGIGVPCSACTAVLNTVGKATGGGWYFTNGSAKRKFGVDAEYNSGAPTPGGSLRYDDGNGTVVSSSTVEKFRLTDSKTAVVTGPATVNGSPGYRYEVTVVDNGEPGRTDTFKIVLSKPGDLTYSYSASGTLGGGNVQVRGGG
jgi:serine protease AprX